MMVDPFSTLYDAILRFLREQSKNRFKIVDWADRKSAQPDVASTQDLPEWQIRPTGLQVRLGSSSCSTVVNQAFQIVLNTGNKALRDAMFPHEWQMLAVLYSLQYSALDNVQFNGRKFVESITVNGSTTGLVDPATNRDIQGWASIWSVVVNMSFSENDFSYMG